MCTTTKGGRRYAQKVVRWQSSQGNPPEEHPHGLCCPMWLALTFFLQLFVEGAARKPKTTTQTFC